MAKFSTQPRRTALGVSFLVEVSGKEHSCLISKGTLDWLAARGTVDTRDSEEMEVFHAFERSVLRAASKVIAFNSDKKLYVLTARVIEKCLDDA